MAVQKNNHRGWNTGSISRNPSGTYRAQVTLRGGKRETKSFKTKKECQAWIDKIRIQISNGLDSDNYTLTTGEFAFRWLDKKERSVRPSTLKDYKYYVEKHIVPTLGDERLRDLSVSMIDRFYQRLHSEGLGEYSQNYLHRVLRALLNEAVKEGALAKNPVSGATPTKPQTPEIEVYSLDEVNKLLVAAEHHRYKALFHLAVKTGMRKGELMGLTWDYVDLDAGSIRVVQQARKVSGVSKSASLAPVKTKNSNRTIKIGKQLVQVLLEHKEAQCTLKQIAGDAWKEQNLVFTTNVGTITDQSNLQKEFQKMLVNAGIRILRFHDLRHTAASIMLAHNIGIVVVSKILGHAKPSITLDIYGHLVPESQDRAMELMDKLFGSVVKTVNAEEGWSI